MKQVCLVVACILLVACVSATNTKPQQRTVSKPLDETDKAYISQIENDGRLIYQKDIRAAEATDLLLRRINPADFPNFVGWITYPNAIDYTVSFYEKTGNEFNLIADVKFKSSDNPDILLNPDRDVSETEKSMLKARIVALQNGTNSCSNRFNTVVIPSQNKEAWDVYVLAATTDPKLVQVGGHVKVTISKSTSEVLNKLALSKSCLALDKSGNNLPEGASISALTISHIVTPMPIAIHPYLNLLHDIGLAVSSERSLWMIESGKFRKLR